MPHHGRPGAHHNIYSQSSHSQSTPSLHQKPDRAELRGGRRKTDPPGPWQHMADTYAWVVEQEFVKLDKHGRNTEQWIQEQQIRFPDGPARQEIGERVRRRMWEDMMYRYEVEAERWMRREEEMRRAAAEQERRRDNLIREELRRMEERLRQQKEGGEQRARRQNSRTPPKKPDEQRNPERPKSDKTLLDSWKKYEDRWNGLSSSSEPLTFTNIPWPLAFKPRAAEQITLSAIAEFLLSPVHSQNLTRKDRIRNAQLRWHPDRFQRMMQKVNEGDKAQVSEGVGIVARSLNELMSREKQRSTMLSNLKRIPLRRCLHTQIPQHPARSRVFSSRLGVTVGASLAVGSYFAWRLTRDQRIALDSASKLEAPVKTALDGPSSETAKTTPAKKLENKHTAPAAPSTSESQKEETSEGEGSNEGKAEGEGSSEGGGGGAYNPVTGEINWDCPCLGGMAYGPCGPEFREAFSCFIHSEEEPKGINCVEKFQAMQTCFREHPEHYADEIMDDDDEPQSTSKPEEAEGTTENPQPTPVSPSNSNPETSTSTSRSEGQS